MDDDMLFPIVTVLQHITVIVRVTEPALNC